MLKKNELPARPPFPAKLVGGVVVFFAFLLSAVAVAADSGDTASDELIPITVFHTNDLQSRLLGFGPNADYTPNSLNDDATQGGVARLMSLLNQRREQLAGTRTLLTLDGGDVMMGTLFHTVSREFGTEFQLLKLMQFDAITLGNHDFDFRPDGLGKALKAAQQGIGLPAIVLSNIEYDPLKPGDDLLEQLSNQGVIKPSMMIEKQGLKFGVIGVLGYNAIEVIGEAEPLGFSDPIAAIKAQVKSLQAAGADILVLLSHSGVYPKGDTWVGDDVDFARAVPELDLIISGHTHLTTPKPAQINKTLIVQAGCEGRFLGELSVTWSTQSQRLQLERYQLHAINDRYIGDPDANRLIAAAQQQINERVLAPQGLGFTMPIVETREHLSRAFDEHVLGNLAADSLLVAAGSDLAITSNGEIRDEIFPGTSGIQQVSDIFRLFPIGIGFGDDSLGYDLVKVYFTGAELKAIMEILLFAYQVKGPAFYPRLGGVEVHYNPYRVPLDKVTDLYLVSEQGVKQPIALSEEAGPLYSVTMTHYAYKFMSIIGELSYGLLQAIPKQQNGEPVTAVEQVLVDAHPEQPGVQKQKAWTALMRYLQHMDDTNGNDIGDIQQQGIITKPRVVENVSLSPGDLLRNSSYITLMVLGGCLVLILLAVFGLRAVLRKR